MVLKIVKEMIEGSSIGTEFLAYIEEHGQIIEYVYRLSI